MSSQQHDSFKNRSKSAPAPKQKLAADPPLSGRYSRSEGAGPGPKRKRPNPPQDKREGNK